MPIEKKTFNKFAVNFALAFFSLLLTFLILECSLRLYGYNPFGDFFESQGRSVFIQPSENPDRIFEATPNSRGEGWGTDISINSHGFRGREYTLEKPKGTYRIIVLGDSITFGNNLPANKNYPALLEKIYAEHGQRVEVLNLGLGGYDTLQEVATLEQIGIKFQPDLVILGYCINDIGIASGNLNYIKRLQKYGSPIYRSRLAQFIRVQIDRVELIRYTENANKDEAFRNTYKNRLAVITGDNELAYKMRQLSKSINGVEGKYFFSHDYTLPDHIQRLRFGLEKLQTLQKQNGFKVFVLIIPYLMEDDKSQPIYQSVYDIVYHETSRLDFITINLYPAFSSAGLNNIVLKENDGIHPNYRGHQIIAETLYKTISTQ